MPKTIELTVFKFEELSKEAQEKAIQDNWDFNVNHDWWDFTYEDAATIGLKITGFDLGRGRSITGDFKTSAIDCANSILENHGEECGTYKLAAAYKESHMVISVKYKLLANDDSEDEDDEITELSEAFEKDILNAYWKILDNEYDYLQSEECIKESLIANEYDFEEDGSRY